MKLTLKTVILFIIINCSRLGAINSASAQCAMCKRIAETNMDDNQNNVGKSLNKGILYLLALPYIIGGIGVFAWYSNKRRKRNQLSTHPDELGRISN